MGFFLGGALVSSAPTAQKCTIYLVGAAETAAPPGSAPTAQKCTIYLVGAAETAAPPERHQPRRNAPFTLLVQQRLLHPLEVHQPRRNAPFTWLVQQRLLHPLKGTNRASTAPTELTIRGYVEVRGECVKTQLVRAESPTSHSPGLCDYWAFSPFTTIFLVLPDSNIL